MERSLKDEVKYLESQLQENPDSILFARLADAYVALGRIDDAIELCERGVRIHPDYLTGHFLLGDCYLKKRLFDQAEKELKLVISKDPGHIAAHREYGELMAQIGWHKPCEMAFEEIIRIDPINVNARQRLEELKRLFAQATKPVEKKQVEDRFKPREIDSDLFAKAVVDETGIDDDQTEADEEDFFQLPATEEQDQPDSQIEDEDASMDLLEDIFSDDNISDLDAAADQKKDQSTKPVSPDEGQELSDKDIFPQEEDFTEKESEGPAEPQSQPEYDPFFELNKMKQSEDSDEEEGFGTSPESIETESDNAETGDTSTPPISPLSARDDDISKEQEQLSSKKEKIVTPTLGEIYAAQRQYAKAISVYEMLLKKDPDNEIYLQKMALLQKKLEESQNDD